MEQGPTFPWYEPNHPRNPSILLSSCVKSAGGDFSLPLGQPPLSPIDLHLQLFPRESAYLSHSLSFSSRLLPLPSAYPVFPRRCATPCVVPSDSLFYFLLRQPPEVPSPPFPRKTVPDSPDTEFAVHFIITLDGNKLSKRCACARDAGVCTRYSACFYNTAHKSRKYAKSRFSR